MSRKLLITKTGICLVIISSFFNGFNLKNSEMRCEQPKAYAFCGAKTWVGTQWFYDSKRHKCLPFKFCINSSEIKIAETSRENRFDNEAQCEFICNNKPFSKGMDVLTKRQKKLHKKLKKILSNNYQIRDKYAIKPYSLLRSSDPKRCLKPKSYSFCGSRTSPQIHWYYHKKQNRCLPYTFCETIDADIGINTENNFYKEKQCNQICIHSN